MSIAPLARTDAPPHPAPAPPQRLPEPPDDLALVLRDYMEVTERLARTHETLQQEIERLRDELETKNRELERRRRLAALGEMAAGVAHEVRNPLGAVQLYATLLRGHQGSNRAARELLDKIDAGIAAINRVVADTLALTPRSTTFAALPVADVVERAVDACAAPLAAARAQAQVTHADCAALLPVDGDGLHRALVNLITNAAQASPPGGVVEISSTVGDAGVTLCVRDHGAGLPEDLLDRIFDPFVTTKEQGTGLGLTIAHRLVEAHGGVLQAGNHPGGGARFAIRLPAPQACRTAENRATGAQDVQFSP